MADSMRALDALSAEEAQVLLRELLRRHPTWRAEAEKLARGLVSSVDRSTVADAVREGLEALDIDDLGARAGRKSWGYVGPGEAAWEVLEPYQREISRLAALGMEAAAQRQCVLLGLYALRGVGEHELLQYCEDAPAECAGWTVDKWKAAGGAREGGRRLDPDFVADELPEWASFLGRKS